MSSSTTSAAPTTAPAPIATPAQQVVAEIEAIGGEAIVNGDNVADWEGAQRLINSAIEHVRRSRHPRQQRRHPPRPCDRQHDRGGVGRSHRRPPQGSLRADPLGRRLLARAAQGRQGQAAQPRAHVEHVRFVRQSRARATTAPPRPASPRSARSPPRNSIRYDVKSNTIAPGARTRLTLATPGLERDHDSRPRAASTSGIRPTSHRSSPTSPAPTASSPARRSSCRVATSP